MSTTELQVTFETEKLPTFRDVDLFCDAFHNCL